jgi:hypothetical protein
MAKPATETLKKALLAAGPSILKTQTFDHYDAKGKVVLGPRLQDRGQGPPGDVHNTGRALDIILCSMKPPAFLVRFDEEATIGYGLVNIFLGLQSEMKWDTMIYDQKEWNSAGKVMERKKPMYDDAMDRVRFEHLTHIHIDWSFANCDDTGFYQTLVDHLNSADFS